MQTISDPNGCGRGGAAISMEATAVFLSVDANFSEKFKVLCVSSFCFETKKKMHELGWVGR